MNLILQIKLTYCWQGQQKQNRSGLHLWYFSPCKGPNTVYSLLKGCVNLSNQLAKLLPIFKRLCLIIENDASKYALVFIRMENFHSIVSAHYFCMVIRYVQVKLNLNSNDCNMRNMYMMLNRYFLEVLCNLRHCTPCMLVMRINSLSSKSTHLFYQHEFKTFKVQW